MAAAATYPALTSSSGFLSMLDDPEVQLQQHALKQLDAVVDRFWPEIATQIPKMSATRQKHALDGAREVAQNLV